MSNFSFKARAVLASMGPRLSPDDATHVSLTCKFEAADVKIECLTAALGIESGPDGEEMARVCFFDPDTAAEANFPGIAYLQSTAEWQGRHSLTVDSLRKLRVYMLNRVSIRPRGKGLCDVTFFVLLESPPDGYYDKLKHSLKREVRINLEQDGELGAAGESDGGAGEDDNPDLFEGTEASDTNRLAKVKPAKAAKAPAKKAAKKAAKKPAAKRERKSIAQAAADSKPEPRSDTTEPE